MLQLIDESDEFGFVVPEVGTLLWEDCIVIPARAPHIKEAHEFIDYLYSEKVGLLLADYLQYATPNAAVKAKMPHTYLINPAIFPSEQTLKKCERLNYAGAKVKAWYDQAWSEIIGS
jgi:spermidine/putrescine transport system substrate-binding protein